MSLRSSAVVCARPCSDLSDQPLQGVFDVPQMRMRDLVRGAVVAVVGQPLQRRCEARLGFGDAQHELLVRPHGVGEGVEPVGERGERLGGLRPAFLAAREDGLQAFHVLCRLFQQRLDVVWHVPAFAVPAQHARGEAGKARQPVLQLVIEAILRLTRLEIEEAQHERAGEAEHRGGKGGRHAGERTGQTAFELVEDSVDVAAADAHALDHVGDRADGLQQAPEGAEQA